MKHDMSDNHESTKSARDIALRFGEAVRRYQQARPEQNEATTQNGSFDARRYVDQIPKRIRRNITTDHPKVSEIIHLIQAEQPIIILSGQNRTGKSTLAASVAMAYQKPFIWYNAFDLLEQIKASWHTKQPWKRPKASLVVIDELEKVVQGEWAELVIDQTICARYDECLPTIVVTNLTADQIKANASNRFIGRVREQQTFLRINKPWWQQFSDGSTPEGSITTKKEERKKEQYPLSSEKLN